MGKGQLVPGKICLIGTSLAHGGANKNQAVISRMFAENGIQVHHVIFRDAVHFDHKGEVFNLGKIKLSGVNKFKRFLMLRQFVREQNFDFIIDFRNTSGFLQEWLMLKLVFGPDYIRTVRSFYTEYYFPANLVLASLLYKKAFAVVTVSKAIEKKVRNVYGLKNVRTILNPLDYDEINRKARGRTLCGPYIVSAGRMDDPDEVKQFGPLISAYHKSSLPSRQIPLVLLGDGRNRKNYQELAASLGLAEMVRFEGFQENPYPWYKNALFYVLSSRNEGFPTALNEAMACGTPAVSFDCPSGPSEIIEDGVNGLLVNNQDFGALSQSMNRMAKDAALYEKIKRNLIEKKAEYQFSTIFQHWMDLFNKPTS